MLQLIKSQIVYSASPLSKFWEPQKPGIQKQEFSSDQGTSEVLTTDMDTIIVINSP